MHVVVNICIKNKQKIYTQGRDKIFEFEFCVLIFLRLRVKLNVFLIAPPPKVLQKNSGTQESPTNLTLQGSEIQTSTR